MKQLIGLFAILCLLVPSLAASAASLSVSDQSGPVMTGMTDNCSAMPSLNSVFQATGEIRSDKSCSGSSECVMHVSSCCASVVSGYCEVDSWRLADDQSSHESLIGLALTGTSPAATSGPPKHTS